MECNMGFFMVIVVLNLLSINVAVLIGLKLLFLFVSILFCCEPQ